MGSTLEVDPVIGVNQKIIELNIAPEIVYEADKAVFQEWKTNAVTASTEQPVFYALKCTTAISLVAGQYHMAGVLTPHSLETKRPDSSRKVLMFVKADILQLGR